MKLLKDKVFIRITNDTRDSIFTKDIIRDDGSKVRLFTNVGAQDLDDRKATLFVQEGIVEAIADNVQGIEVGDTAIIDYKLCNMDERIVYKDDDGSVYWLEAVTVYHTEDLIAYANQNSPRDQLAYCKGDYDTLSMLLGVVRDGKVYSREPYVFLEQRPNVIARVSDAGILYNETESNYTRKVLTSSKESQDKFGIFPGNEIHVHDYDIFSIQAGGLKIDCICSDDVLLYVNSDQKVVE